MKREQYRDQDKVISNTIQSGSLSIIAVVQDTPNSVPICSGGPLVP